MRCHVELIGSDQFVFNYNKLCSSPVAGTDTFLAHLTC